MSAAEWARVVEGVVDDEPLFAAEATRAALDKTETPPRAIYLGIGLCTRHRMAVGVPFDVLGMLLPAERLRRALDLEHLVVLIADAHALANGFSAIEVERRTRATARLLLRIRSCRGLSRLSLLRASHLHRMEGYRCVLARVQAEAAGEGNEYVHRQTADVAFLDESLGGILKLGWTVGGSGKPLRSSKGRALGGGYRDEAAFDQRVGPWSGRRPAFAYVRCGRALDDRRPKVSPYVGVDPARRIYLHPKERPAIKLGRAHQLASTRNVAAVREHLGRIAEAWEARGSSVDQKLRGILGELYPSSGKTEPVGLQDSRGVCEGALALADADPSTAS